MGPGPTRACRTGLQYEKLRPEPRLDIGGEIDQQALTRSGEEGYEGVTNELGDNCGEGNS